MSSPATVRGVRGLGAHNAKRVLDGVRKRKLHCRFFIEIMACPAAASTRRTAHPARGRAELCGPEGRSSPAALYKQDEEMP